jgi:hypothetical protein
MPQNLDVNFNSEISEPTSLERKLIVVQTEIADVPEGRLLVAVIGINQYIHWQKLKNAVQDAVGLQQTLIDKLGFSAPIPPLLNEAATKKAINSLIEDQLREELQEDDNLILFFAGHGHTRVDKVGGKDIGGTGFIIPVDGRGPKEVWGDYIQIDPLLQSISKLPARHILVILDSCHSGFALGEAMSSFRDAVRYEKDLSSRISRKVITSARRDQLALDGGPIPGHSLFTGTMVDGFNWGKADLDGNGLITSSELGLFIQQQVGQASESKQTPDFGSFHLDDRGEMVISLRNQSFDALKARAYSALQNGDLTNFREIFSLINSLNSSSPEGLYLKYRLMWLDNNFEEAINTIHQLHSIYFEDGTIPISRNDIWILNAQLPCWKPILEIPKTDFNFDIITLNGQDEASLEPIQAQKNGEVDVFAVKHLTVIKFKVINSTKDFIHLYMVEIDSQGRLVPLKIEGDPGICEYRFFYSPKRIKDLTNPSAPASRSLRAMEFTKSDLENITVKSLYYRSIDCTRR